MPASKKELVKTPLADGRVELSGATYDFRDQIKARGGKWDPARKVWSLPAGASTEFGAPPSPPKAVKPKPKPREEWTREEWEAWISIFKRRNRGRVEECCIHAEWVGDPYGPTEYSCPLHGVTKGSYTGD